MPVFRLPALLLLTLAPLALTACAEDPVDPDPAVEDLIVFTLAESWDSGDIRDIYLVSADGSEVTQLTHGQEIALARWSPDGSRIGFSPHTGDGWNIYVMDPDGGNVRPVTSGRRPEWRTRST